MPDKKTIEPSPEIILIQDKFLRDIPRASLSREANNSSIKARYVRMQNKRTIAPDALRVLIMVLWVGLAGIFIRIWGLWNYAFNPDEVMLSFVADAKSFSSLWEGIKGQTNAPLMYVILHLLIMFSKNEHAAAMHIPYPRCWAYFYLLSSREKSKRNHIRHYHGIPVRIWLRRSPDIPGSTGVQPAAAVPVRYPLFFCLLSGKPEEKISPWIFALHAPRYSNALSCGYVFCCYRLRVALRSVIEKKPAAEYRSLIMAHLPPLALFCILYFFLISYHLGGGGVYGAIKETYLAPLFPQTFSGFINNARDFFGYLYLPPYATLSAVLSLLGIIALWNTSQRALAATIVLTFAITIVFTIIKLFPFGGSRHSIYLFPMVCLLVGASVQYGFDAMRQQAERFLPQLTSGRARAGIGWALVLVVVLSVGAVTFKMRQCDFLRRYKGPGEFSVTRADYDRIMGYLVNKRETRSVVLTNLQTYHYLAFFNSEEDRNKKTYVAFVFYKFAWEGLDSYLIFVWKFDSTRIINAALRALKEHADLTRLSTIYLVNIGRGTSIVETYPCYKTIINKQLLSESGYVYALSPQAVLREIDAGRFRNTTAAMPLPDNAFKADLSVEQPRDPFRADSTRTLHVQVKNSSSFLWPAEGPADGSYGICLAHHVLDAKENRIAVGYSRTPLPFDLGAGMQIEMQVPVTLPAQPGKYCVEFDMVQEKVAWFAAKGSQPKRIYMQVK